MIPFSKKFVETGTVPVNELLSNSVYYPASGTDGRPIKKFNPLFPQYGIWSYVYSDYGVDREWLSREQDDIRNYHVLAVRELKQSDLVPNGWNPEKYLKLLSVEEMESMKESIERYSLKPDKVYGRWIVYERDKDADPSVGAEQFSLLFICGEGAATYAALYLTRNIAPCVLVDINPGLGWGFNYSCFKSVMTKLVDSGKQRPKYYFYGNMNTATASCILQEYNGYLE